MKLKNVGVTIVSIGKTVLLPDETVEIKGKGYENNAAIDYLVKTNRLAVVKERTAPTAKAEEKKASAPAKDKE